MNHLKTQRIVTAAILFFLFSLSNLHAQTHTARYNTSMVSNSGGYYEYLPEGYSTSTEKYPVIVFIHGMYEKGNGGTSELPRILGFGLPKKIKYGYFPKSFTVNGKVERFVVISPQFRGSPTTEDINGIINYVLNKYRVDPARVYLTGLSMGGAATWNFAGNASYNTKVAAIVPICGSTSYTTEKATNIVRAGIKVWATHNKYDDVVHYSKTSGWVNAINNAGSVVNAKSSIWARSGHDAWSRTYDAGYKEDNKNIFEWMLQFRRGSTTTTPPANQLPVANAGADKTITLPTSSVTLAGSGTDADGSITKYSWTKTAGPAGSVFSSTIVANPVVSGLVAGTYTFRLTVTDNSGATDYNDMNVVVNSAPLTTAPLSAAKSVKVNLYEGVNAYTSTAWNNWNVGSSLSSGTLKYSDATSSTIAASLSKSEGVNDNGSTYGSGMAPAEVLRYASNATSSRTLTLSGLSQSKTYSLELYGSRNNYSGNYTVFTINGAAQSISTYRNLTGTAVFNNLTPNTSGQIVVTISNSQTYNYINGFALTESKAVKVNFYGGTNSYTSTAWNNWNVGSSLSSGTLKYSDATSSTIAASLSKSEGVNDNGSTYGSGMAPAEVLRYASNATSSRTLTLSGLSQSKTYSLELYGSRNNYSGNYTVFTINGAAQSISTYRNLTGTAVFNNLTPNTSGQIVVTISNSQTYNYINGFALVEGTAVSLATTTVNTVAAESLAITTETEAASSVTVSPNPFTDKFSLRVTNNITGAMKVQIIDAGGVVKKTFSLTKTQTGSSQTYLSAGELAAGSYFMSVQMDGWSQSIQVMKL